MVTTQKVETVTAYDEMAAKPWPPTLEELSAFLDAEEQPHFTIQELTLILKCSYLTIYRAIKNGVVEAQMISHKFWIPKGEVKKLYREFVTSASAGRAPEVQVNRRVVAEE